MKRYTTYLLALTLSSSGAGSAWAQTAPGAPQGSPPSKAFSSNDPKPIGSLSEEEPERPWAVGVSPASQERAKQLFREGTDKLMDSFIAEAIAKYEEALRYWDHPAIHFNYAVALSTQDKPLETRRHLLASLALGEGPLTKIELAQAKRYLKLVEASLARLSIEVEQPNVVVSINGKAVLRGPGKYDEYAEPNEYEIRAIKSGYLEERRQLPLLPGHPRTLKIRLYTEEELTRYRRPWPVWAPPTAIAIGAIVAGVGGWKLYDANSRIADMNEQLNSTVLTCGESCSTGITRDETLAQYQSLRSDALSQQRWGTVLLAGGSGIAVIGAVWTLLNSSEAYRVNPEELQTPNSVVQIAPEIGISHVSLRGSLAF